MNSMDALIGTGIAPAAAEFLKSEGIKSVTLTSGDAELVVTKNSLDATEVYNFLIAVTKDNATAADLDGTIINVSIAMEDGYATANSDSFEVVVDVKTPAEITTTVGDTTVGEVHEFEVTTKANDYAGVMVIGTSSFSNPEAIKKLEYYEPSVDAWYELTTDFGPTTGFPLSDATSKFRVTWKTASEYTFTMKVVDVNDNTKVYAEVEKTVTVSNNSALVSNESELLAALNNTEYSNIELTDNIVITSSVVIARDVTIDGKGYSISKEGTPTYVSGGDNYIFKVYGLELANVDIKNIEERLIALLLIDFLDDAGYLIFDDVILTEKLKIDKELLTKVVDKLQGLQPLGVFARDLKECLAIQLKDKNRLDPAMQKLLDNLPLLAKKDFKALQRICSVSAEDLVDMVREIQKLDPKPASGFENITVQTLIPDVFMREDKNGNWIVELNNDTLPKVLLNQSYVKTINKANISKADKKIANNYLTSANWLIKALHQRAETILKVASEIVSYQKEFFTKGIEYLRPLTLKEIANSVEMHESTVSRVTTGKYMETPFGVFELKYFFNQALPNTGFKNAKENHSATTVKYKIKEMINSENPKEILSDEQIAYLLQRQGIAIARRTVAKYREALNIPTSAQRRRDKQIKNL